MACNFSANTDLRLITNKNLKNHCVDAIVSLHVLPLCYLFRPVPTKYKQLVCNVMLLRWISLMYIVIYIHLMSRNEINVMLQYTSVCYNMIFQGSKFGRASYIIITLTNGCISYSQYIVQSLHRFDLSVYSEQAYSVPWTYNTGERNCMRLYVEQK